MADNCKPDQLDNKKKAEQRLALLALTGTQPEPAGPCPDAEELACLVDGRMEPSMIEACLAHLAGCEQCYATWQRLDHEWQQASGSSRNQGRLLRFFSRPRFLAATGSILAVAASIAVFLNLTLYTNDQTLLRLPAKPAQEAGLPPPPAQTPVPESMTGRPGNQEEQATPQPLTKQKEKKAKPRPNGVAPEPEAIAPKRSPVPEGDRAASPSPPHPPVARVEKAAVDQLAEKKADSSSQVSKPSTAPPASPQRAARMAAAGSADTAGKGPLSLAEWQRMIREGCARDPGSDLFAKLTLQTRRLLAGEGASPLSPEERLQLTRSLSLLTAQDQLTGAQRCQALLDQSGLDAKQ